MKVILLQSIKGQGQKGDVIEVSDGFAQNSLIPQGLAKAATSQEINKIKQAQKSVALKAEKAKEEAIQAIKTLNGKTVTIHEKLNEKGSLYHSSGIKEITHAISEQFHIAIPENLYKEKYAFKEAGTYTLELIAHGVTGQLFLVIAGK